MKFNTFSVSGISFFCGCLYIFLIIQYSEEDEDQNNEEENILLLTTDTSDYN